MSGAGPLAIIAGGGSVPLHVAAAATAEGRDVLILGIEGEADARIADYDHQWFGWGGLGQIETTVKEHGARDVVMIGGVATRPDFRTIAPDPETVALFGRLVPIADNGDSSLLSGLVRIFEESGFRVIGAHEIAHDLVADAGVLGAHAPSEAGGRDVALAMDAAHAIGAIDAGQAAVAVGGRIVALEAAEGTDAMLERVTAMRERRRFSSFAGAGALAKRPKPQQDLRVDMPAIGPGTVDGAARAGLAGIAIEAGKVMIVERAETIARADAAGLFLVGATP